MSHSRMRETHKLSNSMSFPNEGIDTEGLDLRQWSLGK